jgi:hypothetical protein
MSESNIPILQFSPFPTEQMERGAAEKANLDGGLILSRTKEFIQRYVHLSEPQAILATVWVAHTHGVSAATATPYLAITSATKQCGKTRLLEIFEILVAKPWLTGRVTAACLVRKVDQVRPTLLLDESDAAFNGDKDYAEALRGILNTGFYAGGVASCCVGQGANITFKDFRTYCPKAIAGIGQLPDTVADRSVPIRLERKKSADPVSRFRRKKSKPEAADIKSRIAEWMGCIVDELKDAEPSLPEELADRQQDAIEPLLAIADAAGDSWPNAVRQAAIDIFQSGAAEDQNIDVQLLIDIRNIFEEISDDKITTVDLIEKLKLIETSPWADWSKGKGLTPHQLSRKLNQFGIGPRAMRIEGKPAKGYSREAMADAWERYLSSRPSQSDFQSVTQLQAAPSKGFGPKLIGNTEPPLPIEDRLQPASSKASNRATDQKPVQERERISERDLPQTGRLCAKHGIHAEWDYSEGWWKCVRCYSAGSAIQ